MHRRVLFREWRVLSLLGSNKCCQGNQYEYSIETAYRGLSEGTGGRTAFCSDRGRHHGGRAWGSGERCGSGRSLLGEAQVGRGGLSDRKGRHVQRGGDVDRSRAPIWQALRRCSLSGTRLPHGTDLAAIADHPEREASLSRTVLEMVQDSTQPKGSVVPCNRWRSVFASRRSGRARPRRPARRAPAAILPMSHNVMAEVAKSAKRSGPIRCPQRRRAGISHSEKCTRERTP